MAAIRVISKRLDFIIALHTEFGTKFERVNRQWWWVRKRYEIVIPVPLDQDGVKYYYETASKILSIAKKRDCYKFEMERLDGPQILVY